jgi:hypothetical protein
MLEITANIQIYPTIILLVTVVFFITVLVKVGQLKQIVRKSKSSASAELQLFEITAKQLIVFQCLIGEIIHRHKTIIADLLDDTSKTFLEDIHAAVELNNQKKEQQLKDSLLHLITEKRQVVASDMLNFNLAVKQLEMLVSSDMALCVLDVSNKVCAMLQHSESYLSHLEALAHSPFDSRLQTKLALSTDDQDTLLQLIDLLNDQFKREKSQLLSCN